MSISLRQKNLRFLQSHPLATLRQTGAVLASLLADSPPYSFTLDQQGRPLVCCEAADFLYADDHDRAAAVAVGAGCSVATSRKVAPFYHNRLAGFHQKLDKRCWPFNSLIGDTEMLVHQFYAARNTKSPEDSAAHDYFPSILLVAEFGLGNALAALATGLWKRKPLIVFVSERSRHCWQSVLDYFVLEDIFAAFEKQGILLLAGVDILKAAGGPVYAEQLNILAAELKALKFSVGLVSPPQADITASCTHRVTSSKLILPAGGFVEDAVLICLHEMENELSASKSPIVEARSCPTHQLPTVIVGSGPSLDQSIEPLRRLQDVALIIACGSSEEALLSQGVVPDFTCHLENTVINPLILLHSGRGRAHRIPMIASASVSPRMIGLYDQTALVYRPSTPLEPLRPQLDARTDMLGHSVGHMGVSVGIKFGATRLYLFGMDMATKTGSGHCRNLTLYRRPGQESKNDYEKSGKHIRANFGGQVADLSLMALWRSYFEQRIARLPVVIYNCSDGAYIKNTVPKLPETLIIPEGHARKRQTGQKKAILNTIMRQTFQPRKPRRHSYLADLVNLRQATDRLIGIWRRRFGDDAYFRYCDIGNETEVAAIRAALSGQADDSALDKCAKNLIDASLYSLHYFISWQGRPLNRCYQRNPDEIARLREAFTILLDFIEDTVDTLLAVIEARLQSPDFAMVRQLEAPVIEEIVDGYLAYAGQQTHDPLRQTLLDSFVSGDRR